MIRMNYHALFSLKKKKKKNENVLCNNFEYLSNFLHAG